MNLKGILPQKHFLRAVISKLVSLFVSLKVLFLFGLVWVSSETVFILIGLLKGKLITSDNFTDLLSSLFGSFASVAGVLLGLREVIKLSDLLNKGKRSKRIVDDNHDVNEDA